MTETLPELHYTEVTINSYPESYKEAMINCPPAVQSWADISLLINPCAPNDCFRIYAVILHIFHPFQRACSLIWHSYICDDALLPACPPSEQGGLLGYLQTRRIMFRSPCVPPLGSHARMHFILLNRKCSRKTRHLHFVYQCEIVQCVDACQPVF